MQTRPRPRSFRCRRCKHSFGHGPSCQECGVGRHRAVRRRPGHHKIGGKRGKNSGKVSQHGKRSG
jgi:hypothetical protein